MDWDKATNVQLAIIRFDDPMATQADKTNAENEMIRRDKKRSGKPQRYTNRPAGFRR
ncbi:hypothetical protein [Paenibacillus sp. L3-i20]|uniref:hypothetical protein n=1 Tax=Paenibacillus sp. L3-i20 TaxID=2905833 RepID=UPI001EDCC66C|nr:hypothetical protein [Paenibacillus sp. L3-i20]GKU79805.1 hypothetical protein L3i20_v242020 [Paenibacillus sp. L3-i20]